MNPNCFAQWLQRRGNRIVHTASSYWSEISPFVYQAFPFHWLIDPSDAEFHQLFWEFKAIGLRYSSPFNTPQGVVSYHVQYTDEDYALSALPKKARYDVRKGLTHASIQPISLSKLANEGWRARAETLLRQGRVGAENRRWWEKLCQSAEGIPGFVAWAAITNGKIVASLLSFIDGDCCSILYQQSMSEHLRNGVNNALTFKFTENVLGRNGVSMIFYGLHSLDAPASIDEYKFRMRYFPKPVRQRVVLHPFFRSILGILKPSLVIRLLSQLQSVHPLIPKATGFLNFYHQGNRPLTEQPWPECLLAHKEELIQSTLAS